LLVCGEESFQVERMHLIAARIPHARTALVPHAGHFVLLDNATGYLDVTRAFLLEGMA
jgi:pimeloyl-ACP methyl ester carboxylesterase